MSLPTNALTTLDTALGELSLTSDSGAQDARIERYIAQASALFERATNRKWYWAEGHVERVPGFGTRWLQVSDHTPVDAIGEVMWDDGTETDVIDADDYTLDLAQGPGAIRLDDGTWADTARRFTEITTEKLSGSEAAYWKVTYDGGYVTPQQAADDGTLTRSLPYDIEGAVLSYVVWLERQRGRDPSVSSERVLSESISYVDGMQVPPMFAAAVSSYKRMVVL